MREIRKVNREWQIKNDGEWETEYIEPNINILQPDYDGIGFFWKDLELKDTGKKGKGVFCTRDLEAGTTFPILGMVKDEGDYSRTHSWEKYDRSRPVELKKTYIDGHPSINPHLGVASFGLSISMMLNESGRLNCVFRQSNYVQLVRKVKQGQELTVFYGNSREMEKIRREQGYSISHDPNTITKPPEVGTPAQRVSNWKFWMGTILLLEKDKTRKKFVSQDIKTHIPTPVEILPVNVPRPKRIGDRNTFHCKYKGNGCPNPIATLYINEKLGVDELHCMVCMKREIGTMNGAVSIAPMEYEKLLANKAVVEIPLEIPIELQVPKRKSKAKSKDKKQRQKD